MSIDFVKVKFDFQKSVNHGRWGGWPAVAWDKESQAVVVCMGGRGMVIDYVGAHLDYEVTEMSADIEENGLTPPHDGIFIWTGKYIVTSGGAYQDPMEYESYPAGEFRELTLDEMGILAAGGLPLEDQPLNPGFCEELVKALEAEDNDKIREHLTVLVEQDLNRQQCYVFVAEAAGWEVSSESLTKFEKLLETL